MGLTCPRCKTTRYYTEQKGQHVGAYCSACNVWIKWVRQGPVKIYFGKYKGRELKDIPRDYLEWMVKENVGGSGMISEVKKYLAAALRSIADGTGRKIKEYLDGAK